MGIGEQFKGLDMKNLIGGPLSAAAEASVLLANCTASFINQVGFDAGNKTRTAAFKFSKKEPDDEGNLLDQDMLIDVPLLAIVPIPNLQIDEVNITFDMEVKECSKEDSSKSMGASLTAGYKGFGASVSISGSISSTSSNTRSTDNSAKYHVDVRATNHGTPEGLARVLDMMAACVSPNLVGSRTTDESGAELTGGRRERSQKLKVIRERGMQLERAERAANNTREIRLGALVRQLENLQNATAQKLLANTDESVDELAINEFWKTTVAGAKDKIVTAAAAGEKGEGDGVAVKYCPPLADKSAPYTDVLQANTEFNLAVKSYLDWESKQKAVEENKAEYNSVMMETSPAQIAAK